MVPAVQERRMLRCQIIVALCMFGVGLTTCLVTEWWSFSRITHLFTTRQVTDEQKGCKSVEIDGRPNEVCPKKNETQFVDVVLSYGKAAELAYKLPGSSLPLPVIFHWKCDDWTLADVPVLGRGIFLGILVFVIVVMIFGVVQARRLHRGRPALCGMCGFWASRGLLWTSGFLVQVLFFVQVVIVTVMVILDRLCPDANPDEGGFHVKPEGYCGNCVPLLANAFPYCGSELIAAFTLVGYFLVDKALILMASAINAEFAAVACAPSFGTPLLGQSS